MSGYNRLYIGVILLVAAIAGCSSDSKHSPAPDNPEGDLRTVSGTLSGTFAAGRALNSLPKTAWVVSSKPFTKSVRNTAVDSPASGVVTHLKRPFRRDRLVSWVLISILPDGKPRLIGDTTLAIFLHRHCCLAGHDGAIANLLPRTRS